MLKETNISSSDDIAELCIICGTLIEDLDEDDIVQIQYGKLCYGCFNEGWFKKCGNCGKYVFESDAVYDDSKDQYHCKECIVGSNDE